MHLLCRMTLALSSSSSSHDQSTITFSLAASRRGSFLSLTYRLGALCIPAACAGSSSNSSTESTCDDWCFPYLRFFSRRKLPVRLSNCHHDFLCPSIAFRVSSYAFATKLNCLIAEPSLHLISLTSSHVPTLCHSFWLLLASSFSLPSSHVFWHSFRTLKYSHFQPRYAFLHAFLQLFQLFQSFFLFFSPSSYFFDLSLEPFSPRTVVVHPGLPQFPPSHVAGWNDSKCARLMSMHAVSLDQCSKQTTDWPFIASFLLSLVCLPSLTSVCWQPFSLQATQFVVMILNSDAPYSFETPISSSFQSINFDLSCARH